MINNLNLIKPFKSNNNIAVLYATDEFNIKYLSISLVSLISKIDFNFNYDIIIFYISLKEESITKIKELSKNKTNVCIRFIKIDDKEFYKLNAKKDISIETYLRIYAFELSNYSKIIYLDTDTLILDDIKKLYNLEIGNKCLAAVKDIIGIGIANSRTGKKRLKEYKLLPIDYLNYFNAGVLIFNLNRIRKMNITSNSLIKKAIDNKYAWQDQDLLNVVFYKEVNYLDYKWNYSYHKDHVIECSFAPNDMFKEWKNSLKEVKIIHFSGNLLYKPWYNKKIPFGDIYWTFIRDSMYKDVIIERYKKKRKKVLIRKFYNCLFPVCSRRRLLVKTIIYK